MTNNIHDYLPYKSFKISLIALVKLLAKFNSPYENIFIEKDLSTIKISSPHKNYGGLLYYDPFDKMVVGCSLGWANLIEAIQIKTGIKEDEDYPIGIG